MRNYYLLWAVGPDRPGIVAALTKILLAHKGNLEDSSMMRLGAEFGVFLIFTTHNSTSASFDRSLKKMTQSLSLSAGYKKISPKLARFPLSSRNAFVVTLHGADKPGLVHAITSLLAGHRFNISDLETHRTSEGKKAGYILVIEGTLPESRSVPKISKELNRLEKSLKVHLSIKPVLAASL